MIEPTNQPINSLINQSQNHSIIIVDQIDNLTHKWKKWISLTNKKKHAAEPPVNQPTNPQKEQKDQPTALTHPHTDQSFILNGPTDQSFIQMDRPITQSINKIMK